MHCSNLIEANLSGSGHDFNAMNEHRLLLKAPQKLYEGALTSI